MSKDLALTNLLYEQTMTKRIKTKVAITHVISLKALAEQIHQLDSFDDIICLFNEVDRLIWKDYNYEGIADDWRKKLSDWAEKYCPEY